MKSGFGKISAFLICLMMLGSALVAVSGPKEKEKPGRSARDSGVDVHVGVDIFVGNDRKVIQNYFHSHTGNLPPGLAKRGGNLPPGLEKQLRRKGHLPPGLEKKLAGFPVELERRLPPLKPGLVRGVIEGRAVIMNSKTSMILDIFTIF